MLLLIAAAPLLGQWVNVPDKVPRTKDGKPDFTAPAPLAPDGKPDLSGTWMLDKDGFTEDLAGYFNPRGLPTQLWAQAITEERQANGACGKSNDLVPPTQHPDT